VKERKNKEPRGERNGQGVTSCRKSNEIKKYFITKRKGEKKNSRAVVLLRMRERTVCFVEFFFSSSSFVFVFNDRPNQMIDSLAETSS
jgi:hypothetical protein